MRLSENHYAAEISRLATIARATVRFHANIRARMTWARHYHRVGPYPSDYVFISDGTVDLEGLIIGGTYDDGHGWDFDGEIAIFTDDGEILTVKGWMATSIEVLT
jgi:hypothetical protein